MKLTSTLLDYCFIQLFNVEIFLSNRKSEFFFSYRRINLWSIFLIFVERHSLVYHSRPTELWFQSQKEKETVVVWNSKIL